MESIVVTLTSWGPRYSNLPAVLDSIYSQTLPPDKIVLNIDENDPLPESVNEYLTEHGVEIYKMPNLKVYKKLIPTLKRYPECCVISIDDDWIYPREMIADFMSVHQQFPDNPISGNKEFFLDIPCHCGCASLTKASFFGKELDYVDDDVIRNCYSDDLVYMFLALRNGVKYVRTEGLYFINMEPLNQTNGYSDMSSDRAGLFSTWDYLTYRFGLFQTRLLVVLELDRSSELPFFIEKMKNICCCQWNLLVSGKNLHPNDKASILSFKADADFYEGEKGSVCELLSYSDAYRYDLVLNLHSMGPLSGKLIVRHRRFYDFQLRDTMVDAILKDRNRFSKVLGYFEDSHTERVQSVYAPDIEWSSYCFISRPISMLKRDSEVKIKRIFR